MATVGIEGLTAVKQRLQSLMGHTQTTTHKCWTVTWLFPKTMPTTFYNQLFSAVCWILLQ